MDLILFQIGKVKTVSDSELAGSSVNCFKTDILMYIFYFSHSRVWSAVRVDKPIAKEVTVTRGVYTKVTSISPVFSTIFVFLEQTLIYPVPNISSLKVRIFVNSLPLSPKVSGGITHCMCIFRRSYRTVAAVLACVFQPTGTWILRNIHIGVPFPLCAFIVNRTSHDIFVCFFHPQICLIEVVSVSGFVS